MLQTVYDWIKNMLIFMIGITLLLHLLGKSNYQKYAKLIAGMILILFLAKPILSIINQDDSFFYLLGSYDSLLNAKDSGRLVLNAEDSRNSAIFLEYKKILASQTEQLLKKKGLTLASMEVTLEEDLNLETYGSLQSVSIVASYQKEEESSNKVSDIVIERILVSIGEENTLLDNIDERKQGTSPLEISTKNMLADFYNLDASHINIIIREDNNG